MRPPSVPPRSWTWKSRNRRRNGREHGQCWPMLIRRILMLVPVFLAVSIVIFLILHLIPGDPIDNLLKVGSSPEPRAEMDGPLRAGPAAAGAIRHLARQRAARAISARPSSRAGRCADLIAQTLPHSLRLGGLALAVLLRRRHRAGRHRRAQSRTGWPDRAIMGGVLLGSTCRASGWGFC